MFNYDSGIMRTLSKITDIVILNLLTLICCIPIITIGTAITAAHYAALKLHRDRGYVAKNFFRSFKMNLWFVFAIVYLYLAFYLCTRFRSKSAIIVSLFVLVSATIILLRQVGYDRCWWVSLLAFPTGCLYSMYKDRINGVLLQNRLRYCFAMTAAVAGVELV